MGYVLLGGIAVLAALLVWSAYSRLRPAMRADVLRWGMGGGAVLLTVGLAFGRRIDLAAFTGAAAFSILRYGRLGPITLGGGSVSPDNISKVRSRYLAMTLDHDSGAVEGRVIAGQLSGRDLIDLGEIETRALIKEIAADTDSMTLLESWLDANRAGWREYFAETAESASGATGPADEDAEAYAVLGLQPGATADEIKAAHRELMKGVHPDHGGSSYLAAKINEARDRLLRTGSDGR
ncbi:MAG: DnaJ domain-containing protein [Chloroflexia bacterium]